MSAPNSCINRFCNPITDFVKKNKVRVEDKYQVVRTYCITKTQPLANIVIDKIAYVSFEIFQKIVCWVGKEAMKNKITLLNGLIKVLEPKGLNEEEILKNLRVIDTRKPFTEVVDETVDLTVAIRKQAKTLVTTIKLNAISYVFGRGKGAERIAEEKTKLQCLLYLNEARGREGVKAPSAEFVLKLSDSQNQAWVNSGEALKQFPDLCKEAPDVSDSNEAQVWNETLSHIEKEILPKPFKEKSAEELKETFIEIKEKLFPNEVFRTREHLFTGENAKTISQIREDHKADEQLSNTLGQIEELVQCFGSVEKAGVCFTQEQWDALQKVAYVAPAYQNMDTKLEEFFGQLETTLKGNYHPYQVVSFIHFGLTRLRPFENESGVCARLFMNIFLMQCGITPLVIPTSNEGYAKLTTVSVEQYEKESTKFMHEYHQKMSKPVKEGGCTVI